MPDYDWNDLKDKTLAELLEIKKEKMEELARVDKECLDVIGGIMYFQKEIHRRKNEMLIKKEIIPGPITNNLWNCCQMGLELDEPCPICSEKYED